MSTKIKLTAQNAKAAQVVDRQAEVIKQHADDLAIMKKNRESLNTCAAFIDEIFNCTNYMTAWVESYLQKTPILVIKSTVYVPVASMTDSKLVDPLTKLIDAEYTSSETRDYASEHMASRRFSFSKMIAPDIKHDVMIEAELQGDSPTCKKVLEKVETKMVETPIYKIVCS